LGEIIRTEASNPVSTGIDLFSSREIVEIMNSEDKKVAVAVESELDNITAAVNMISEAFLSGGTLLYFGAGTSGRLGILDASECPPTFSVPRGMVRGYIAGGEKAITTAVEGAEDSFEGGENDLVNSGATGKDVVVGISASGNAAYIKGALSKAKQLGIKTVGIACNPDATMREYADVFICPDVGPEVLTGSTRLKAGTAQKMVLNMLTTASMIRIGKVYCNYMIDVSPTNVKLRDRATRIVAEIAGITYDEAAMFLEKTGYRVKPAVVVAMFGVSVEKADELLARHNGRLREAIE
jgi:N-acetylmuramic acid 6-phosphate etherase